MTSKTTDPKAKEQVTWTHVGRSTKETVESIIIAFILAFVFRAFIVEAYRIPTGSMAPTLYGAHQTTLCPDCGYDYAFEIQQRVPKITICPNCKWINRTANLVRGGQLLVDGGDRILVMKLGYGLAEMFPSLKPSLGPKRWDVVVFKNPANPDINFIKRLIGLPGEKIELIDGDVYVNDKIARKTDIAMESLWFLVYNNDYLPTRRDRDDPPADVPGWVPVDKTQQWKTSGRVLFFHGDKKDQPGTIAFNGHVQDFYAYDDPDMQAGRMYTVSDIKLEFMLNVHRGDGEVDIVLSKRDDVFIARINTSGKAQLFRTTRADYKSGKNKPKLLAETDIPRMSPKSPELISFENLDYRVQLKIGKKVILQTTDEQYHPNTDKLRKLLAEEEPPIIQMTARDFDAQFWHVNLMRDVYYRPVRIQTPSELDRTPLTGQLGHGVVNNPIHLGPSDYYVLGDNSPESMDSRLWYEVGPHLQAKYDKGQYKMGTVPADQMVGKAFFVYWPAGFRMFQSGPPLVPNVGEMRFIR